MRAHSAKRELSSQDRALWVVRDLPHREGEFPEVAALRGGRMAVASACDQCRC